MQKILIYTAKIIIFTLLLTSCAKKQGLNSINNRSELKKAQKQREKHTRYWSNDEESKQKAKAEKKAKKAQQKELKKGQKRHLNWQDQDVKKRIKKNNKKAQKALNKKAK